MPVNMESKYRASYIYHAGALVSPSNRFPVDAQLTVEDIQIGAVEIKNHNTATRASVVPGTINNALVTTKNVHDDYKAGEITATTTEQELDFGADYVNIAISNGTGAVVEIRLNANTNDPIVLAKQGDFSHDNFRCNKIFYQLAALGPTSDISYFVSRVL